MKRKLNKWLSGVLAACVLFTTVPVYAINNISGTETSTEVVETSEETQSSEIETSNIEETNQESSESIELSETTPEKDSKVENTSTESIENTIETSSEEQTSEIANEILNISPTNLGDEEEPSTDNWELGLVFYDSTVDNGKTPLTSIDWDASDGSYKEGTPRVITVQINYKNTNAGTTYQPGDLSISIDSLLKGADVSFYNKATSLMQEIVVGANDSTHTGFNWNYTSKLDSENEYEYGKECVGSFTFTNANIIEEKSNFEGSIQIVYTITPRKKTTYNDEHTYSFSNTLKAVLNNTVESNEANFNYTRTYIHPWQYREYTIDKTASKISSLDGLPEGDYYWVKYVFDLNGNCDSSYPYIGTNNHKIIDTFPSECIVLNESLSKLTAENDTYTIPAGNWRYYGKLISIYVGYPKSIYNDENGNLNITNHADLYSQYKDSEEYIYSDDDDVSLNLSNFDFTYSGDLYGISKLFKSSANYTSLTYYESLIGKDINVGNGGRPLSRLSPKAIYTGNAMDIKFGDDLLYITGSDGNYRKLNDNEYYFLTIEFPTTLRNGNGITISDGKYDCELWVRYAGNKNFTLYEEFKNGYGGNKTSYAPQGDGMWTFEKNDNIVGYYFIIKEMTESLNCYYENTLTSLGCSCIVINNATDIAESGSIFNFAFIQVYIDGVLQNEADLNSYANFITKDEIAAYDQNTYGLYMQRAVDGVIYSKYKITKPIYEMDGKKDMSSFTQDSANEVFSGKATLTITFNVSRSNPSKHELKTYGNTLGKEYMIEGFEIYDLLPEGMTLTSTKDDIINSLNGPYRSDFYYIFDSTGQELSVNAYKNLIKKNINITITENWNNTNRTYLHITVNLENNPLFIIAQGRDFTALSCSYNYEVSYDSFLEYGNIWTNRAYFEYHNKEKNSIFTYFPYGVIDDGRLDMQESDINQNGNTIEILGYDSDLSTITSVVSTHQDVQTQTSSTLSNYSTGTVPAEYGKDYSYKLRVRTGKNDVTNLIIYDNLEKWVKDKNGNFIESAGSKEYWQGELQSIDTSYAESKGYNVKVWYSENEKAGTLAEDSSWKEYIWPTLITDSEKTVTITSPNWPNNYPDNMTETNNYWEQSFDGAESIQITFDSASELESASYDYLRFYDRNGKNITNDLFGITADKIGGSDLAGKTVNVPGDYVKITMSTDGSYQYKGFSAQLAPMYTVNGTDNSKIKSLAFQYLDSEGNPAVLPANSSTYVEINMRAPADESIKTLAYNGCWTQWNAIDEFGQTVDFITGINSNIVKVALPNSIIENEIPSIQLNIEKEIQGTTEAFENMQLDPNGEYQFMISLVKQEENEDGSHDVINGVISNKKGLVIKDLSYGTWLITESDDTYFDLVEMIPNNDEEIIIEGVTLEKTDKGYVLTISDDLSGDVEFNIKVTNKIEPNRPYEDKEEKENLFKILSLDA